MLIRTMRLQAPTLATLIPIQEVSSSIPDRTRDLFSSNWNRTRDLLNRNEVSSSIPDRSTNHARSYILGFPQSSKSQCLRCES
jgi:hypothetical protein